MKKKILSFMLAVCMVIGFIPYTALAAETRTVTVIAGAGGKVSADGANWNSRVTVKVPDGEKVGDRVVYRADEGYELADINSLANITAIAAGKEHTVIIDDKGQVYTSGSNSQGQRAIGDPESLVPFQTATWFFSKATNGIDGVKVKDVSAGRYHTVVLSEDGDVYTSGYNYSGQLGRNVSDYMKSMYQQRDNTFIKVDVNGNKIKAIAASSDFDSGGHTVLIDEDGKVWTGGNNYQFPLGRTTPKNFNPEFKQAEGDVNNVNIVAAAAGTSLTVLLDENGDIWTAGDSSYGENGQGGKRCKLFTKCAVDGNPKITAVAAGSYHSVLLDENGNVYTTGRNSSGQLGLGDNTVRNVFTKVTLPEGVKIVAIAAGSDYTVLLDDNGTVYTAGNNNYGQLGLPLETDKTNTFTPVTINDIGENKIVAITAGESHTILLDDAGRIWSAGSNKNFPLGRLVKPYKESNPDFALAMSSEALSESVADLSEFEVNDNATITINFKEKEKINVIYDLNGGSWVSDFTAPTFYYKGNDFTPPELTNSVRNGYTPTGWSKTTYDNSEKYTMKWEPKSEFTVHYDTKGGTAISDKTNVKWTDKVLDGVSDPIKTGYEFKGWKCDGEVVTADTTYADLAVNDTVTAVTFTAQWFDVANPTGKIEIAGKSWNSLSDNINFEFFKETQTVTVTAADNSGEEVKVEYLLSNKKLDENELREKTFTKYAQFMIKPDNEYVIYVKLTDTSNNVAYINTDGIVLDSTAPVISGIENNKTYCKAQTVTVTENYIDTVTVNGNAVTLDDNNSFLLDPADSVQKIVATDKAGNETAVSVTVNDGHTYDWQSANGQYWQKCKFCNHETAPKDIPTITISSADTVCRTQDYVFRFTLPEGVTDDAECGYGFALMGGDVSLTVENGVYIGVVKAEWYDENENIFNVSVYAKTDDGFVFSVEKTVTVQNEHSGGTATCTEKAKCEVCGESYGEFSADNHSDLKHVDAKAATETDEGNTEYWYCSGCGKYYKDAEATQEITKADTVTAKLPEKKSTSPKTGDTGNLAMWIALLFVSGGAAAVAVKKKKHSL